jgi:haloalkane dehalogenase
VTPQWVSHDLYPFDNHYVEIDRCRVHYVDEGTGPPLLLLHGNVTWSFLYRNIIAGLRHRFRCVAVDYPGFGLSTAAPGYGFTPVEHARVLEDLITFLDLQNITMMVHDWGGPIGFAVATRHPERFTAFVIGNTFAWPKSDFLAQVFSRTLGGPIGAWLVLKRNFLVETALPANVRAKELPSAVMDAYRGPFPTPESRRPQHIFARQILASRPWLAEIERRLPVLHTRPALILWPTHDIAFRNRERRRWQELFPSSQTITLHNAGRFIAEDAAAEIVAAVLNWWPNQVDNDSVGG